MLNNYTGGYWEDEGYNWLSGPISPCSKSDRKMPSTRLASSEAQSGKVHSADSAAPDFAALHPGYGCALPIAVEMPVAVIAAAAVAAAPAAIGNPEHTLDRADGTADAGADGAADHTADRTGGPVTFVGAFLRAA
ncbi:hypothetical protein H8A99_41670, partial [Bradyrhizobium sp. Arg68]|nr:hypothetical protein [Bradyrhizobium ivorense]